MTLKKFIEFFGAGGDLDDLRPSLVELRCCGETHRNQFSCLSLKKTQTNGARSAHPIQLPPPVTNTTIFYFAKWRSTYIIWCIHFIPHTIYELVPLNRTELLLREKASTSVLFISRKRPPSCPPARQVSSVPVKLHTLGRTRSLPGMLSAQYRINAQSKKRTGVKHRGRADLDK